MNIFQNRRLVIAVFIVGFLMLSTLCFTVPEGSVAVVTRFGAPVRVADSAGLHFKLPTPFEGVYLRDARRRLTRTRLSESLTRDKKNVVLVTYTVWKLAEPVKFLQAVGDIAGAEEKLDGIVINAKNAVLGNYDFDALVSQNPQNQKIDAIEADMTQQVQTEAKNRYGIEVMQVGLQRLALPEDNLKAVFNQMRAERSQFAAKFQAEGDKKAAEIRADADLTAARLTAEGAQKSEEIRGRAEAGAAAIYAKAHKTDPNFYRFTRSLESMKKIIGDQSTVVMDTDSAPFNVLKNPQINAPAGGN